MIEHIYVLARNEQANLRRSLEAAQKHGIPVTVLDSGSTDGSRDICREFGVPVEDYPYVDHCTSYNDLTVRHGSDQALVILDADMILCPDFIVDAASLLASHRAVDIVTSPITMWWAGAPLRWGSLCPPKPIAFRGGGVYFEPAGHGERLQPGVRVHQATSPTVHDDRRPYRDELLKQVRYAEALIARSSGHDLSGRDRLRMGSPLLLLLVPIATYILRLGFLSGRTGLLYAVDRLIAEAIMYRVSVYHRTQPREPLDVQSPGQSKSFGAS